MRFFARWRLDFTSSYIYREEYFLCGRRRRRYTCSASLSLASAIWCPKKLRCQNVSALWSKFTNSTEKLVSSSDLRMAPSPSFLPLNLLPQTKLRVKPDEPEDTVRFHFCLCVSKERMQPRP